MGVPRTPISIEKPDREFLNSDIHMNLVCTHIGDRITGMYHFCHRYKPGESNPSMVFLREDGKTEVWIPVKWGRDMSRYIRDSEERRRRKREDA